MLCCKRGLETIYCHGLLLLSRLLPSRKHVSKPVMMLIHSCMPSHRRPGLCNGWAHIRAQSDQDLAEREHEESKDQPDDAVQGARAKPPAQGPDHRMEGVRGW